MDLLDLPHLDVGPRDAMPVVLLHGFPLDHAMWAPQKEALQRAGFRVIAPDLRGQGKAPVGHGPATMQAQAADALRMLDRAGVRRFALAGFSMGGYVAFEVLRQAPGRVAGLALVDTRAEPDSPEARQGRYQTAARVRKEGPGPVVEGMLPRLLTSAADPALRAQVERTMRATPPEGMAQALEGMGERPDSRSTLAAIRVPTLIVVGEQDAITPTEAAKAMADAIPGAKLVVVPGAAHLTTLERPDAVSDAMVAWARSIKP